MSKIKTYIVYASETVLYEIEVQARSPKEAQKKVFSGELEANFPEPVDSNGFQIDDVSLKE